MDTLIPALDSDHLPPPSIKESRPDGLLDPHAARSNLTVGVDFPWQKGDVITIECAGTPGLGSYLSPQIPIGRFARPFQTHIDNLLIAFNFQPNGQLHLYPLSWHRDARCFRASSAVHNPYQSTGSTTSVHPPGRRRRAGTRAESH